MANCEDAVIGSMPPDQSILAPRGNALRRVRYAFRENRICLALTLALLPFWIYKLRDLALPYFWDELGVYARAAVYMHGNVFMKRYLLCLLPPLAILGSRALFELVRNQTRVLLPAVASLCLFSLSDLTSPRFNCAYDMSFRKSVLLQQEATWYVEETVGADKPIFSNLPPIFGLEDPRYGYVRTKFKRFSGRYSPEAEYIFASELFDHFTPPAGVRTELTKRFSSPYTNVALYRILRLMTDPESSTCIFQQARKMQGPPCVSSVSTTRKGGHLEPGHYPCAFRRAPFTAEQSKASRLVLRLFRRLPRITPGHLAPANLHRTIRC